jgi:hypothetical protein
MRDVQRVWRVCVIDYIIPRLIWCRLAAGQHINPWIRRSEHALYVRRCV